MILKPFEAREADVLALEALIPKANEASRKRIEQEIRNIRAGDKGERAAAYELDLHLSDNDNWVVIHGLRVSHGGFVAQFDHVVMDRLLQVYIIESKHFSDGIRINASGEFESFYGGTARGIASPIEQNRRHMLILERILESDRMELPRRLGMTLRPDLKPIVLVSNNAKILRPRADVVGLETVIKCDQLMRRLSSDDAAIGSVLRQLTKVVSRETLLGLAQQLVALHEPIEFDWAGKFGLRDAIAADAGAAALSVAKPPKPARKAAPEAANVSPAAIQAQQPAAPGESLQPTTPAGTTPTATPAGSVDNGLLSTSKLAAALGLSTSTLQKQLVSKGLLEFRDGKPYLTPAARELGAQWRPAYGGYMLWPASLQLQQ